MLCYFYFSCSQTSYFEGRLVYEKLTFQAAVAKFTGFTMQVVSTPYFYISIYIKYYDTFTIRTFGQSMYDKVRVFVFE